MKIQDDVLAGLIDINSKVLDVGCGDGNLLLYLKRNKRIDGRGLEINQKNVQECLAKGLAVVEGDAEKDLVNYPNQSFDIAILNQAIQQFYEPRKVLNELLRIAKQAIITIPNFGYWKVRLNLLVTGTMPVTKTLPHSWYDTPNLHMSSIKDFYNLCSLDNINVIKSISISSNKISDITSNNLEIKNLVSELGVFVVSK
ncbi:MAG: methionine biosynthesis protein MetW [Pelagibacteraceae bacterium]|jgi:methionine biosynthesis protein MetW|uniref:methionine biosynthesis protein MetW n=1 Tax=Candidatus Pelagibacter sp. HIMB1517 TaxID=3413341 RepID=UPI0001BB4993|nr:methionine biosynthesis protein MetW [Pelagibacteraceae bacterium]MCI5079795.1 methionine biosynthesis protein MetW [Pelagibacteraceae bacterium]OUV88987.1 MAG: methionine biosynthesis protein MetW [Pelagibacteraceae bacterium TMED146]|tara:strand:- start:6899 stop:7495 length:597 start_codon:yes stop_codon:yes gene_type:complete